MRYNKPESLEAKRTNIGFDSALIDLQTRLKEFSWLNDYVFLRAYENRFPNEEGQFMTYPQVYMGKGEYYNALPNDNLPCTVFFRAGGSETVGLDKEKKRGGFNQPLSERPVSLIFWGNLERMAIPFKKDAIYTEELKEIFIKTLSKSPFVLSIESYLDEPFNEVFSGYTVSADRINRDPGGKSYNRSPANDSKQYDKYPFVCFRIDFTVTYRLSCDV